MLNIQSTIGLFWKYILKKESQIKFISFFLGIFVFVEILRGQVVEINLLQLIPGFYLLLLFISFLFLTFTSNFILGFSIQLERKKRKGIRDLKKGKILLLNKLRFFFFFTILLIGINSAVPLSLDSFNSYGEKTLENVWSFGEVIYLEIIILFILVILSQFPLTIISFVGDEKVTLYIPEYSKYISFFILIFSGFITPTIDGYTQLSFAASTFSLYLVTLNSIQKRLITKPIVLSFVRF